MKKLFFLSCMFLISISFAKKWDATYISKLIASGGIDKVIQHYQEKYYGENRDPQDAFRIAELYVRKKDYATAMQWYDKESQLINTSKVNLFNYANTNRLMGNYQKALDGYLMYAAQTGDVNKVMDLANQCEKILKASSQTSSYKLENYSFNTSADEINVAVLRTNPVYVVSKKNEEKESNEILQIVREYDNFLEPVKAYKSGVQKLIITSLSYTQDGNSLVFSAREASSKKQKNEKIYFADNLGANFLNVKPFPFNADGFSCKNPAFNTNGTALYFSSNQTGGFGAFDIWESKLENGKWTKPVNLGKLLNTKTDEINPFMVQDGQNHTLYFSSDREGGFGAFDIYKANNNTGIWQDAEMQPAPINSAGDDISIIYDSEVKTGYFSSNRMDGKGGFDVYRFIPFNLKLVVNAYDSLTEKILDYALVQVFENNNKVYEGVTNENGKAEFQVDKNKSFTLKLSKDNYRPITTKVNSTAKMSGDSVVADVFLKQDAKFAIKNSATNNLSLDNYIIFTGHVVDAATNKPAKYAKLRMVNYSTQKLREVDIDSTGKFEIKLLLNNNYKVIFENQENKIIDELTTYGMERYNVKVRDYVLNGAKFKLTENKVYKAGTVPPSMNLKMYDNAKVNALNPGAYITHEPITQTKIDSLKKVISRDNPQVAQTNKSTKPKVTVSAPIAQQEIPKVIAETKLATTNAIEKQTIVVGKKEDEIKDLADEKLKNTIAVETPKIKETPIEKPVLNETETIVKEVKETKAVKPIIIKDDDVPQLAADMVSTQKSKKVKNIPLEKETPKLETPIVQSTAAVEIVKEEKADVEKIPEPVVETKPSKAEELVKEIIREAPEVTIKETPKIEIPTVVTKTPEKPVIEGKKTTPFVVAEVLPELYYKVQLASYDAGNIKFPEFEHLGKIEEVKAYERYIYRLGNFDNLERAKEVLELVRSQGYFVAFILQYNKDKVTGIVN